MSRGWIGCDLDGTIAEYTGWRGETHIGRPIMPMVDHIRKLLAKGYEVRILTARMSDPSAEAREAIQRSIGDWTAQHIGVRLTATCVKDYDMVELYDDRAVQVEMNVGRIVGYSSRGNT